MKTFKSLLLVCSLLLSSDNLLSQQYTWKPLRVGAGGWLTGIDIAPDGSKVVRTDTYGAYVWNGMEWQQLVTTETMPAEDVDVDKNEGVYEIRIAPGSPNRFYMMYRGMIYRSDSKGNSWTRTSFSRVSGCDPNDDYRTFGEKMAVDPSNPDVVYAGTSDNGLWMTENGGADWISVSDVIYAEDGRAGITGIVFDQTSAVIDGKTSVIYAASWATGVYRSTDAGATWALTTEGPVAVHHGIVSSEGIYYAVDGSQLWQITSSSAWTKTNFTDERDWHSVAVDPADPKRLVLGEGGGTLKQSQDGGATWGGIIWGPNGEAERIADDIPWLSWTEESYMSNGNMIFDPTESNKLYFAEGIGVWYTDELYPDQNWSTAVKWKSQSIGIEQLVAIRILVPPGGKPVLASWDRPIFYITDPDSFPDTHGPDNEHAIMMAWGLDYAVDDPQYIAAIINWWEEKSGYSTDGGQTWNQFSSFPVEAAGGDIAVSSTGNIVWVPQNNGVPYYSKNNGETWTQAHFPGAPTTGETGWGWAYYLRRDIVASDQVLEGTFYAYNYISGLYRSVDGGETWDLIKEGELVPWSGFNAKLRTVPGFEGHLFFTVGQQGGYGDPNPDSTPLVWSKNGGYDWEEIPNVNEVYDIGFGKPAGPEGYPNIYIAGWVKNEWGIWSSVDACETWIKIGDFPLGSLDAVVAIAGDPNIFGRVYVGFMGSGYAYADISSSTSAESKTEIPHEFILYQNYPNPFNPTSQIEYYIPVSSYVTLKVYNALGQLAAILFEGHRKAGNYVAEFDASELPSGVYVYSLESGNVFLAKKVVVIK